MQKCFIISKAGVLCSILNIPPNNQAMNLAYARHRQAWERNRDKRWIWQSTAFNPMLPNDDAKVFPSGCSVRGSSV
jgi:hypothetical protein